VADNKVLVRNSWLIFLFGLVFFSLNFVPEFIAFQTRFALFAQEMLRNGIAFFPSTYQGVYPDYPSTSTIAIYVLALMFGKVTHFAAIFPTALTSSLILVITYRIGCLRNEKWGMYAVFMLLLTQGFVREARTISLDQYTSLFTALSFYVAYSASQYTKHKRLFLLPILFVCGFLFRGPIGLIIPASVVCSYYLFSKQVWKLLIFGAVTICTLLILWKLSLFLASLAGGTGFAHDVASMQVFSRISGLHKDYFYYWSNGLYSYALSFPIAVIVVVVCWRKIMTSANPDYKFLGYLVLWALIILMGLSIPAQKKLRYVVSAAPALSLIAAYIFVNLSKSNVLDWLRKIVLFMCRLFPFLVIGLSIVGLVLSKTIKPSFSAYYISIIVLVLVSLLVSFGVKKIAKDNLSDLGRANLILFVAAVSLLALNIFIIEPINYNFEKTAPFAKELKSLLHKTVNKINFYNINPDGLAIKLMVNLDSDIKPRFINGVDAIKKNGHAGIYLITKDREFSGLPDDLKDRVTVLFRGQIGHKHCLLFRYK
jgi:4-amino-4-deoxy-L-arabinose transferase-like glycosyltransferase